MDKKYIWVLGGIAILLLVVMWQPPTSLTRMSFDTSIDKGQTQVTSDMVITYTQYTSQQPADMIPFFKDLSANGVKVYRFDYLTDDWSLWYNSEFVDEIELQDMQLNNLDPGQYAFWDGAKWETKLLVSPVSTDASFTYSYTDILTSGYVTEQYWDASKSSVCTWKGNTYNYGNSFCEDDYLWVCYAGDPGVNDAGFKARVCNNGCSVESSLEESLNPRAFCEVAPESCYYIPYDATVDQGLKATDCESRGGTWNWCALACDSPDTCYDGVMNQDENGIDCEGPCDATCPDVLQPRLPTCYDGIQNQGEWGIDCGGSCDKCATYPTPASCYDNIKNQGEAGVDCGGPCASCDNEYRPRPVTSPNQHDCVYSSLPTLTLSVQEACPDEYICPLTGTGFFDESEALQDCGYASVESGVSSPTIIVNEPTTTFRDAYGKEVCPDGGEPASWQDVTNSCAFNTEFVFWAIIFLTASLAAYGKINKKGGK